MDTRVMASTVPTRASPVLGGSAGCMPRPWRVKSETKIPIMKISEWAKLMSRSTP